VGAPAWLAFVVWGLTGADSWVDEAFAGFGHATLFDADFRAKPAYDAVAEVFRRSAAAESAEFTQVADR